jgi:dihydroorotate dehydrogenase
MISETVYKFLKDLDPETAHIWGKRAMRWSLGAPGPYYSSRIPFLFGHRLDNRLGLAAGFDKNGELLNVFRQYGFGFLEVGSVTWLGGKGNPRPRLFRLGKDALLNRMGLNGDPASVVVKRLKASKETAFGVNIAKTHSPDIMGDKAMNDILQSLELLQWYGAYTVLNISCPNTNEGMTFEEPSVLRELLTEIRNRRRASTNNPKPLLIKISPATDDGRYQKIIELGEEFKIDGYVISNTVPFDDTRYGKGGLSGSVIRRRALNLVENIRKLTRKLIIGCGGIMEGDDIFEFDRSGADLCQCYTGFVNGPLAGVNFAHSVLKRYDQLRG